MNIGWDVILAVFTSFLHIVGYIVYNYQVMKGSSKPNTATWFLWSLITILNFTSYNIASGDWVKSLLPTISALMVIMTFLLTLLRGKFSKLNKFDNLALVAGLISVLVWWQFNSAVYANLILQAAILIGFVPTYLGVFRNPKNEKPLPWLIWSIVYVLGTLIVLLRWNGQYIDIIYPLVTGLMAHGGMALLSLRKK